jgi:hypothetical protein
MHGQSPHRDAHVLIERGRRIIAVYLGLAETASWDEIAERQHLIELAKHPQTPH